MKQFSYSLQKILDLRSFELEQAEAELGKVNAQIAQLDALLKEVAHKRARLARKADTEEHGIMFLSQAQAYFILLDKRRDGYLAERAQLELVAEQRRAAVRSAMQKVKVLEKLKEKKLEAWKDDRLRQEELVVDDVVTAQSVRRTE